MIFGLLSPPKTKSFRWSEKVEIKGTSPKYFCYDENGRIVGEVQQDYYIETLFTATVYINRYGTKNVLGNYISIESAKMAVYKELIR